MRAMREAGDVTSRVSGRPRPAHRPAKARWSAETAIAGGGHDVVDVLLVEPVPQPGVVAVGLIGGKLRGSTIPASTHRARSSVQVFGSTAPGESVHPAPGRGIGQERPSRRFSIRPAADPHRRLLGKSLHVTPWAGLSRIKCKQVADPVLVRKLSL